MSANKPSTGTTWVDHDDPPELTDAFFEQADEYVGKQLVKRGRPKSSIVRERITIRLEHDVVQQFKASGPGWQTRMNAALVEWLRTHEPSEISL
jgi:uncharacterized protein (DUF4415 family)